MLHLVKQFLEFFQVSTGWGICHNLWSLHWFFQVFRDKAYASPCETIFSFFYQVLRGWGIRHTSWSLHWFFQVLRGEAYASRCEVLISFSSRFKGVGHMPDLVEPSLVFSSFKR